VNKSGVAAVREPFLWRPHRKYRDLGSAASPVKRVGIVKHLSGVECIGAYLATPPDDSAPFWRCLG
jgi:hypothetical protein